MASTRQCLERGFRPRLQFIAGISDVVAAYQAAIKGATTNVHDRLPQTSSLEKANAISDHLHADQATTIDKIYPRQASVLGICSSFYLHAPCLRYSADLVSSCVLIEC